MNKETTQRLVSMLICLLVIIIGMNIKHSQEQQVASQETVVEQSQTHQTEKEPTYTFRNEERRESHYQKHGVEMGFSSAEEYEKAASEVVENKDALHKTEKEDGDDVYYLEETNEFVIVSTDGYIRTYFNPSNGIDYYNRQ